MTRFVILRQGAVMGIVRAPRIQDATRLGRVLYGRPAFAVLARAARWLAALADARDHAADAAEVCVLAAYESARARRRAAQ